jgi:hypothetical protein
MDQAREPSHASTTSSSRFEEPGVETDTLTDPFEAESLETARVQAWVETQLRRLGFRGDEIELLIEAEADWHSAASLLANGCQHQTATRLLT